MLAWRVSSPRTARPLSAAALAADFGPKHPRAQQAIEAIRKQEIPSPVETYYSLLIDCVVARATSSRLPIEPRFADLAEPLLRALSHSSLPEHPTDLFKNLYLDLFSKASRRALGEYYTPDWLAERLLAHTIAEPDLGDPSKRLLDPACGSGTFLVLQIRHIRQRVASGRIPRREALPLILRNVVGFDVHPLAVRTARANYLCALGDLLPPNRNPIDIPVYQADSIVDGPALPPFDSIIGNPPWVNWQNLPEPYRRATMPLWERYGLFPKRRAAIETILGAAKYDLSMLMIYAAADRYLNAHGRLGFIVSQSLFKAAAAGQGFRRFRLPDGTPLAVRQVEDFVKLKPFPSAANRTATLVLEKGRETQYPVEYCVHGAGRESRWHAQPIAGDLCSPWIAAPSRTLAVLTQFLGPSDYRAREGANTGGANAVFWLEVIAQSATRAAVRNVTEGARKQVPAVRATIESELLYPLLRGKNVARWSAVPQHSILLPHRPGMKLRAIPELELRSQYPRASSYLNRFATLLRQRPAYKRYFHRNAPFYSLFNIGDYTFAPWKVVWREQALPFTAAVVGLTGHKMVIPDHKLMTVAVDSEPEAHYLCGALNSLPVRAVVAAYGIETQINTHVLEHLRVPRFHPGDPLHQSLAAASCEAHAATRDRHRARLQAAEDTLDQSAARLWSLHESDLDELRAFLRGIGVTVEPACA